MAATDNIDNWLDAFPKAEVEREVSQLESELTGLTEQYTELRQRIDALQAELSPRKQALSLWRALREPAAEESEGSQQPLLYTGVTKNRFYGGGSIGATLRAADEEASRIYFPQDIMSQGPRSKKPTLRNAILRLLGEQPDRVWKLSEIRAELVDRGWLGDDDAAANRLQTMSSGMVKRGQLIRPATGFYALPTPIPQEQT